MDVRDRSLRMLYGLLVTLYIIIGVFLILIILIQKGKGSMGLGSFGGTQILFWGIWGTRSFSKSHLGSRHVIYE